MKHGLQPAVQRKCECGGTCASCRAVQRSGEAPASGRLDSSLSSYLATPGAGHALDPAAARAAESRHGGTFADVRVHDDSRAHHAARSLHARAMTVGTHIFFSSGRYQPQTLPGQRLLSHELTHVAQQRGGSVGSGLVEDPGLERQAEDVSAGRASVPAAGARIGVQRSPESPEEGMSPPARDAAPKSGEDDKEEAGPGGAPRRDAQPADGIKRDELRLLNLLPPPIRPVVPPPLLPPKDSESKKFDSMLGDAFKPPTPHKGPAAPSPAPSPAKPKDAGPVTEQDVIAAARALFARCERDRRIEGDPGRRQPDEGGKTSGPSKDAGEEVKERIESCLDTPEGEVFTEKAKAYLLSARGRPVTAVMIGALAAYFGVTGKIAYIPPIPLGKGAELSLEVDGPVERPEQVMLKLKVSEDSAIAQTLWKGVKAVGAGLATFGGWIWKGLKAVGRGIATVAGWIWKGIKWLVRQIFDKVAGLLGRVVHWMLRLPFRLARLFTHLIEGVLTLRPWSLAFWKSLGRVSTWVDALKWLGTVAVDLLEIGGLGEAYETINDLLKFNTRSLSNGEQTTAKRVFGDTIIWPLVRVDEAAVIGPAFSGREYTSFHLINGWGGVEIDTLIHELTHVWQYETAGAIYMPQALHAQATAGYEYGELPGLQAAKSAGQGLSTFNREQQAQIVQDFFLIASGKPAKRSSATQADQPVYAHFVKDVSSHKESDLASLRV